MRDEGRDDSQGDIMTMLTSLEIKNFRTFAHLRIERLGQVNLILGKNNVGKTTLLEALQVYASPSAFTGHYEHSR